MSTFAITPDGPFSLGASIEFLEGFTPATHEPGPEGHLHLASAADGTWEALRRS